MVLKITRHAVNPHPCYLASVAVASHICTKSWTKKNPRTIHKNLGISRHESSIIFSTAKPDPHRKPLGYQGQSPPVRFLPYAKVQRRSVLRQRCHRLREEVQSTWPWVAAHRSRINPGYVHVTSLHMRHSWVGPYNPLSMCS